MASEQIIEVEPYLKPIADDNPGGPDLREQSDADFATVKSARRKIVSLAKAARFDNSIEPELTDQWRIIRKLAPSVLKKKSKDLEVAAWLTESLLKLHGVAGLRDGFAVVIGLLESFWDSIYPAPDEDGLETKIYPLISLNGEEGNGTLVLPIKNAPLLTDGNITLSLTSLTRVREAIKIEDPAEKDAKLTELGVSEQNLQNLINAVSAEEAASFVEDLDQTLTHWQKIGDIVDQKCQEAGTNTSLPISGIRGALEEVKELYQQTMKSKLETAQAAADDAESATNSEQDSSVGSTNPAFQNSTTTTATAGPTQNRDQAIKQLKSIAQYFRSVEPHSPMAGIIDRAAEWARLPLPELLAELIPDANARMHYSLMTGIQITDQQSNDQPAAKAQPSTTSPSSPAATDTDSAW